jgi:hypothetical protein
MNREPNDSGLVEWLLGSFHTTALAMALLLLLYPLGGLGDLLQGLSTATGLALFLALWLTTLYSTRRALRGLDWLSDDPIEMGLFFGRALRWGALNGVLFLLALGIVLLTSALLTTPLSSVFAGLGFVVFAGFFGAPVALVIGSVVGVTLGALDIAALRVARRVVRWCTEA